MNRRVLEITSLILRPPHPAFVAGSTLFVLQATKAGCGGLGTRLGDYCLIAGSTCTSLHLCYDTVLFNGFQMLWPRDDQLTELVVQHFSPTQTRLDLHQLQSHPRTKLCM